MTTATKPLTKRFLVFYAGGVEYDIAGRRYHVRYFANKRMPYNNGVLEQKIAEVGTVRHDETAHWHNFPPAEVVALFPRFVGARFTQDYRMEYDGPAPRTIPARPSPNTSWRRDWKTINRTARGGWLPIRPAPLPLPLRSARRNPRSL